MQNAAAFDFVVSFEHKFNGFGIDAMLFSQDFFGEGGFRVLIEHGHCSLQNDRAGVEIFVDEVDGATGEFYAIFEGLALGFEAGKRRQQRRMNIQDAIGKFCDKKRGEKAHVAGETDEVDAVLVEDGGNLAVVGFSLKAFRGNDTGLDSARFGALDAGRAFAIADGDGDFRIGDAASRHAFRERLEVRAAAAQEHAYALLHKQKTLAQAGESAKREDGGAVELK
jgi:hypothetical protein